MKNIFYAVLAVVLLGAQFGVAKNLDKTIEMQVTSKGFVPNAINVAPGTNLTLVITRKTDVTCATEIDIPSQKIKKDLPLNEAVTVKVGKLKNGEVRFACGMNMIKGVINVK